LFKVLRAPRQPFVGLVLAAAVGILLADFRPMASGVVLIAVSAAALATLIRPRLLITYAVVLGGFFWLHSASITNTSGQRLAARLGQRNRAVAVSGAVVTEPKTIGSGSATFLLRLNSIQLEGKTEASNATILVRWRGDVEFGDELQLFGIAEPIGPPRNPGEFDMRAFLKREDVLERLTVRYAEDGSVVRHGGGNWILRVAHQSRARIQSILCRGLEDSPEVQNFISGLTLGLRHQTTDDIEEPFQQTGTLHLFAVAGLHVGIVAELLWLLASVVRLPRKWAAGLIIPSLLFYACVTGLHISSVRASIMAAILFAGVFFERPVLTFNSLAAAAFVLLSWNTQELFSTGFQLSFAVVGTIILLANPVTRLLGRLTAPDPFLPRVLWGPSRRLTQTGALHFGKASSVSMAAWLGSLVLILWYLNLVTPVSLVANLAVVPIAFLILAAALLSLISAPVVPWLSLVMNNANWAMAHAVLALVHLFALLPGGHYYVEHPHWPDGSIAHINVLDLGAGAAVHLRAGQRDWLIDCGSDRAYDTVVRNYLHGTGINRLDGLVLTHGDSLHIGAAARVLDDVLPRMILDNPLPDRSIVHRRIRKALDQPNLPHRELVAGDSFYLTKDVDGHVFYPSRLSLASTVDDQSIVLQVRIGTVARVLFVSDSGRATENALLRSGIDLRSDILVKGQHHSSPSGAPAFLDAVKPRLIIATSRDFPENERIKDDWVEELQRRGIRLLRQDETGAVQLRFRRDGWDAQSYITGEVFRSSSL
jgi:ComEC/Rec2-related protein